MLAGRRERQCVSYTRTSISNPPLRMLFDRFASLSVSDRRAVGLAFAPQSIVDSSEGIELRAEWAQALRRVGEILRGGIRRGASAARVAAGR